MRTGAAALASRSRRVRIASLALVARRAVEDQDAVEVVHLVLDDAGLEARGLDRAIGSPSLVLRADAHVDRALDVDVDARAGSGSPPRIDSCSLPDHSSAGLTSALTGLSCSTR